MEEEEESIKQWTVYTEIYAPAELYIYADSPGVTMQGV
jgi:hypothetical protein